MSEALFSRAAGADHEARSAGTDPADHVHPNVVAVMREIGIDLSERTPQLLTEDLTRWADVVVTMGCGDSCPVIPGKRYVDWDLIDPSGLTFDEVRHIRDDIGSRIKDLVKDLDHATIHS